VPNVCECDYSTHRGRIGRNTVLPCPNGKGMVGVGRPDKLSAFSGVKAVFPHQAGYFLKADAFSVDIAKFPAYLFRKRASSVSLGRPWPGNACKPLPADSREA
jgi:hypothetical protein